MREQHSHQAMQDQERSRETSQTPGYSDRKKEVVNGFLAICTLLYPEPCLVQFPSPVPRQCLSDSSGRIPALAQRQAQLMVVLVHAHPGSLASSEVGIQRGPGHPGGGRSSDVEHFFLDHKGGQGQMEVIVPFNRWAS